MVAADGLARFEQHDIKLGSGTAQRERDQPAGQPPSGNRNVVAVLAHPARL